MNKTQLMMIQTFKEVLDKHPFDDPNCTAVYDYIKERFLEVYPEISSDFNEDDYDGQNAFEVALGESGFFDMQQDLKESGQYNKLYDELWELT